MFKEIQNRTPNKVQKKEIQLLDDTKNTAFS